MEKSSIAFIQYFSRIIQQMKKNGFIIHFLVEKYFFDTGSYFQPANKKKNASDNTRPIKLCDVASMFTYSHLNTPIDPRELTS